MRSLLFCASTLPPPDKPMQAVNGRSRVAPTTFDLRPLIGAGAPFQRLNYFPNGNCNVAYRKEVYILTKA
jgi:hypothetical protein